MTLLLALLPQAGPSSHGLGIEWMPVASIVVPFLMLLTIILAGRKRV